MKTSEDKEFVDIISKNEILLDLLYNFKRDEKYNDYTYIARKVFGQQISYKHARKLWLDLAKLCDGNITKEKVVDLTDDQWKEIKIPKSRRDTLIGLSKYFIENEKEFQEMEPHEKKKALRKLKGIGEWTAAGYIAQFIADDNQWVTLDVAVYRAMKKIFPQLVTEIKGMKRQQQYKYLDNFAIKRWSDPGVAFRVLLKYANIY